MTRRGSRLRGVGRASARLAAFVAVAGCMGVLVAGLAVPVAGLAWFTAGLGADAAENLALDLDTSPLRQRSELFDRDGHLIATFYEHNRVDVPLGQIAEEMQHAVIAIEDSRFYEHGGFDIQGTIRAFVSNRMSGRSRQGGSTITQQLVKMTLVEQADTAEQRRAATAQTYARKLREVRYAKGLERAHDKQWILDRYLNAAYFGSGAYGVEAAAERYFSRRAAHLSVRQAALLAGLVKNPNGVDPLRHPIRALRRRNVVIDRMATLGMITAQRAAHARSTGLGLKPTRHPHGCFSATAPFFCDYVREYLLHDAALGKTRAERLVRLRTGGLTIKSTLDPRAQLAARKAVRRHVFPTDHAIGALAVVEPGTGKVRALAQSRPMGTRSKKGQTFLNYLVPPEYGDANGFQAGSTFKVFVVSAAIEQGIPLDTTIKAPPELRIPVNRYRNCNGPLTSDNVWHPHNSTGSGTFDLYSGTQHSVNTFFAQLELRTGLCRPFRLARKMGVQVKRSQQVPTFTLGVVDTDPLTMAEAYATFAARGRHCASRPVIRVRDAAGSLVVSHTSSCSRAMPRAVADAVNDILRGVQEPGGFGYGAGLGLTQQSAGKTGTTDKHRAVWFIGYTPNLAAAAMVAGANRKGHWMSLNGQVVGGRRIYSAAGSTTAGPIWGDAMHRIQSWLPDRTFVKPDPRVVRGRQVTVPDVSGLTFGAAEQALRRVGLVAERWHGEQQPVAGTVHKQSPRAGAHVGSGSSVRLKF